MLVVLILHSCEEDAFSNSEDLSKASYEHSRNEKDAIKVARNLYNNFYRVKSSRTADFEAEENEVYLFDDIPESRGIDNNGFYIVNFPHGGFAVVGTEETDMTLYGVSNEGRLDVNTNSAVREYLSSVLFAAQQNTVNSNGGSGGVVPITPADPTDKGFLWEDPYTGIVYVVTATETKDTINVEPPTSWGQYSPYNLSYRIHDKSGKRYPAGCVPVAIGQICAYHRKANLPDYNLNWNEMLSSRYGFWCSNIGQHEITTFFSYLKDYCSVKYEAKRINGEWDLSTGATLSNALYAFKKLGYTSAKETSKIGEVYNSLMHDGPVYIQGAEENGGNRHAWVISSLLNVHTEYQYYELKNPSVFGAAGKTVSYFQFNWGWNGEGNGYFISTENMSFHTDMHDRTDEHEIVYSKDFDYIVNIQ